MKSQDSQRNRTQYLAALGTSWEQHVKEGSIHRDGAETESHHPNSQ